jgi:hypothetical protein
MNRIARLCLLILPLALFSPVTANAASVSFMGQLNSGSGIGGILGPVPPALPFSVSLDFDAIVPGIATINSGLFTSSAGNISVSGGDILLVNNGANDQALFVIDTSGPTGSLSVTFNGNAVTDNQVTSANLIALINASAPSTLSASFPGNGNYTGSVTSAVPEPSAFLILSCGLTGLAFRRRTRR